MSKIIIHFFKLFLIILCITLGSCSSTGPLFQPKEISSEKKVIIYIYRPDKFCSVARKFDILVNDQTIVELKNNGYTWFISELTTIEVIAKDLPDTIFDMRSAIIIHTEQTKVYYLKFEPFCTLSQFYTTFKKVPEDKALQEIVKTRYQKAINDFVSAKK